MPFEVTVSGISQAIARMEDRARALSDLQPALLAGVKEFGRIEEEHFASGGADGAHGAWKPNTPNTLEYKAQTGRSSQTLVGTGLLRASLAKPTVFTATPLSVTAGTRAKGARYQQQGFNQTWMLKRNANGLLYLTRRGHSYAQAARKPIDLTGGQKRLIAKAVRDELMRRLAGH